MTAWWGSNVYADVIAEHPDGPSLEENRARPPSTSVCPCVRGTRSRDFRLTLRVQAVVRLDGTRGSEDDDRCLVLERVQGVGEVVDGRPRSGGAGRSIGVPIGQLVDSRTKPIVRRRSEIGEDRGDVVTGDRLAQFHQPRSVKRCCCSV